MWIAESAWWQRMKLVWKSCHPRNGISRVMQKRTLPVIVGYSLPNGTTGFPWQRKRRWPMSSYTGTIRKSNSNNRFVTYCCMCFNHGTYHRSQLVTMLQATRAPVIFRELILFLYCRRRVGWRGSEGWRGWKVEGVERLKGWKVVGWKGLKGWRVEEVGRSWKGWRAGKVEGFRGWRDWRVQGLGNGV